jgi:hypothetical protein
MSHEKKFIGQFIEAYPSGTYEECAKLYTISFWGKEPKNGKAIFDSLKVTPMVAEYDYILEIRSAKAALAADINKAVQEAKNRVRDTVLSLRMINKYGHDRASV